MATSGAREPRAEIEESPRGTSSNALALGGLSLGIAVGFSAGFVLFLIPLVLVKEAVSAYVGAVLVGSAATAVAALLVFVFRRRILRMAFGNVAATSESAAKSIGAAVRAFPDREAMSEAAVLAAREVGAVVAWARLRSRLIGLLFALSLALAAAIGTLFIAEQTELLQVQNDKLERQLEVMAGEGNWELLWKIHDGKTSPAERVQAAERLASRTELVIRGARLSAEVPEAMARRTWIQGFMGPPRPSRSIFVCAQKEDFEGLTPLDPELYGSLHMSSLVGFECDADDDTRLRDFVMRHCKLWGSAASWRIEGTRVHDSYIHSSGIRMSKCSVKTSTIDAGRGEAGHISRTELDRVTIDALVHLEGPDARDDRILDLYGCTGKNLLIALIPNMRPVGEPEATMTFAKERIPVRLRHCRIERLVVGMQPGACPIAEVLDALVDEGSEIGDVAVVALESIEQFRQRPEQSATIPLDDQLSGQASEWLKAR